MSINNYITVASMLLTLTSCVTLNLKPCQNYQRLAIVDTLYFGTDSPQGKINHDAWQLFLSNTISPVFNKGLTVIPAYGQWQTSQGKLVSETSYLLQLIHPDELSIEQSILAIIENYKSQFQQESVLRVKTQACVSY